MDTAARHPDFIAVSFNEIEITYKDLNERVNRFAAALQKSGLEKGDRIAFLLVNSPTYVIGFFAAMKIGAVVVNLNVGIQGEELIRCLNDSGAKAVITLDLFALNLYRVIRRTKVETVILHSVLGLEKKIPLEEGAPTAPALSGGPGLRSERQRAGRSGFFRRPGGASVYQRIYGVAQGGHADPRQCRGQRLADRNLGGNRRRGECAPSSVSFPFFMSSGCRPVFLFPFSKGTGWSSFRGWI